MSENSKIEWTDATWTPIRAQRKDNGKVGVACVKVSPACKNCYAERLNMRNLPAHGTGLPYTVEALDHVEIFLDEGMLMAPLRWKRPRKIFVCSQTDLFGEFVPYEEIGKTVAVMALAHWHTFQVLTKRSRRMLELFSSEDFWEYVAACMVVIVDGEIDPLERRRDDLRATAPEVGVDSPLPNVWLGVTAEDQQRADERIPHLLRTSAAKRFVSVEPMLGPVDLGNVGITHCQFHSLRGGGPCIDWVIIGGESGDGARPMDVAWVRDLRDQCKAAGVACFITQMGEKPYISYLNPNVTSWDDELINQIKLKDRKGGDMAEWPEDLLVREFPV